MWPWAAFLSTLFIKKIFADCGREQINGGKNRLGFLTSPGYPQGYPGKQNCLFNLTADPGFVVHIVFVDFDLENEYIRSAQCLNDYVVLTVTDREGKKHIGPRQCGKRLPDPLKTMQSNVLLNFVSIYASNRRGFRLQYEFVPEAQVLQPISYYGDHDTRWRRECGGHNDVNEINGEILSPGFPSTYPRNVSCNWLLRVNAAKRIYIRLVHLELSPTISECERASLYIVDGYKHDFHVMGSSRRWIDQANEIRFCGGQLYYKDEGMKSYLSQGNRVIIKFVTHDSPAAEQYMKYEEEGNPIGFKLLWTEVNSLVNEAGSKPCDGFTCKGGEFCIDDGHNICAERTRLCINQSLQCNGIANCAENDNSDEHNCYSNHIVITAAGALLLILLFTALLALLHRIAMRREIQRRVQERAKAVKHSIDQQHRELQETSNHQQKPPETNNDFSHRLRRLSPAFFTWSRRTSGAESTTPSLTLQETNFRDPQSIWQLPLRESPRPPKVRLEPLQAKTLHRRGAPLAFDETQECGEVKNPLQKPTEKLLRLPHSALV